MRTPPFFAALLLSGSALAGVPQTIILDVQKMTCAACPITVKKALEQVPNVEGVKVDFKHKTATVQLGAGKADMAMLTKATTDAGFPSTVRK